MAVNWFAPLNKMRNLVITDGGNLSSDNGNFSTDGNGNVSIGTLKEAVNQGTAQALSTGNTITLPANTGIVRVSAAAAVTGIILPAGTIDGQTITVIHISAAANTITFAASGTSHVADGASDVITGPSCRVFKWSAQDSLWYKVG